MGLFHDASFHLRRLTHQAGLPMVDRRGAAVEEERTEEKIEQIKERRREDWMLRRH
ncbi:hypothetical protein V8C43DRAFT_292491 [Trichoderma afarasin]